MADLNINKDTESKTDTSIVSENPSTDLASVVDDLLNQLSTRFSTVSSDLIAKNVTKRKRAELITIKVDEMSRRLDNLESTIQANNTARPEDEESK